MYIYCSILFFCNGAIGEGGALKRCSRCQFAYYCNVTCQKSAWLDHKHECAQLTNVHPRIPTDMARIMARVVFKRKTDSESLKTNKSERTFEALMSHVTEIQNDPIRMEHFTYVYAILREYVGDFGLPSSSELLEIFGKICINSFNLIAIDGAPIGVGLYLDISILDHSCQPDAVIVFDGPTAVLNYIGPIENSKAIDYKKTKISYTELLYPSADRKQQLNEQYYFLCDCSRCHDSRQDQLMQGLACSEQSCDGIILVDDGVGECEKCHAKSDDVDNGIRMIQRIKFKLEELDSFQKRSDFGSIFDVATSLMKESKGILHPTNVFYVRLLEYSFDAGLQLQKWSQSVEFGIAALVGYRMHFPRGHPTVTYQLAKIGKILLLLNRLREAEPYLQQALNEANISHGDKHPLLTIITKLLSQCRGERLARMSNLRLND